MILNCLNESYTSAQELQNFCNLKRKPKKYMLNKMSLEPDSVEQLKNGSQTPDYFTNMIKEQRKNLYVTAFIRKLKQSIVRKDPVQHESFAQKPLDDINTHMTAFQLPKAVEYLVQGFLFVQIFLLILLESFSLMFDQIRSSESFFLIIQVSLACIAAEMVKGFFTVGKVMRRSELELKIVARAYLCNSFPIDAVTAVVLCLQLFVDNEYLIRVTALLTMVKVKTLMEQVDYLQLWLIDNMYREQIWSLVKVFLFNFIFAHCLTIVLVLMAGADNDTNWMTYKGLTHSGWMVQYVWGYYWAITIMLTVGFGDIIPQNTTEAICMILIETTSCLVLAYNVNCIGNIISKIRSYNLEKSNNLKIFSHMTQKAPISEETNFRISNYIRESTEIKRNYNLLQEKEFVQKLPESFRVDLLRESNRNIWNDIIFFKNMTEKMIERLAINVEKKFTHPEEIIYNAHEDLDVMILNKGSYAHSYRKANSLMNGRHIAVIHVPADKYRIVSLEFLFERVLPYDIKCVDYTILYRMGIKKLLDCLKEHAYDFEYYCMVKHKDRHFENQFEIQLCTLCEHNEKHTLFKCPRLHYIPLKRHIINKYLSGKISLGLENQVNLRPKKKPFRPLLQFNKIQMALISQIVMNYQEDNFEIDEITLGSDLSVKSGKSIKPLPTFSGNKLDKLEKLRIYQDAANRLKDEMTRILSNHKMGAGLEWDLELDVGYNFKYYFTKENPGDFVRHSLKLQGIKSVK